VILAALGKRSCSLSSARVCRSPASLIRSWVTLALAAVRLLCWALRSARLRSRWPWNSASTWPDRSGSDQRPGQSGLLGAAAIEEGGGWGWGWRGERARSGCCWLSSGPPYRRLLLATCCCCLAFMHPRKTSNCGGHGGGQGCRATAQQAGMQVGQPTHAPGPCSRSRPRRTPASPRSSCRTPAAQRGTGPRSAGVAPAMLPQRCEQRG
jgi:hypothetical protein